MNTMQRNKIQSVALSLAMVAVLAGCESGEQNVDSAENQASIGQTSVAQEAPGHVKEFDGFTLRANVSPTNVLPDSMAREYDIEPGPNLVLLNLVILENRSDGQPAPVSAEVRAQYESLIGHIETVDIRAVEADGHVSYIGTLDASTQRSFQLMIEAQPAGTDQLLDMNFEVQL